MINNFESFINESYLGINISDIKKKAFEFHKTKECRLAMLEIDISILNKAVKEVQNLVKRYGAVDDLAKDIVVKSEAKNEGLFGGILLAVFGFHAIMKLLKAIKDGWSLGRYLRGLFYTEGYNTDLKTPYDFILTTVFIVYLIIYIVQSRTWTDDAYQAAGVSVNLEFKWNGIHDFIVRDPMGKIYSFKRVGICRCEIYYNDVLIGKMVDDQIYDMDGRKKFTDIQVGSNFVKFDLEKVLTGAMKENPKISKEIRDRLVKKQQLEKEIEDLERKTFENVDQTRKFLKSKDIDYDEIINTDYEYKPTIGESGSKRDYYLNNIINGTKELKKIMTDNNNIGYLGTFVKFLDTSSKTRVIRAYHDLMNLKDLINKLRDNDGNLKQVIEFDKLEDLEDSINRVKDWKIVNDFIRELPPTQKKLLWKDGWFSDDVKDMSQFLTTAIIALSKDVDKKNNFLRKVSSIKDRKSLIDIISAASNKEPWDFDHWVNKLNNTRNVIITWSSKEENQIICAVFTHSAIRKIAYMTNWCIVRDSSYFRSYTARGEQYILYDFNHSEKQNESVIGFTVKIDGIISACHNKSDYGARLPDKFITQPSHFLSKVNPEYIKFSIKNAINKLDSGVITILRAKLRRVLNKPKIASFIDWYDES